MYPFSFNTSIAHELFILREKLGARNPFDLPLVNFANFFTSSSNSSLEIDESILSIEIQNATARSLKNEIDVIKNDLEKLNRADVITSRAKNELNMVVASPETLVVAIKKYVLSEL